MGIVAGIDEAGYGPLLGPLVVSVAAFRVAAEVRAGEGADLWAALGEATVLRGRPPGRAARADPRLIVCDSKVLYQGGKGLPRMEEAVLAFRGACAPRDAAGAAAASARDPWAGLVPDHPALLARYPWYEGFRADLPRFSFRSVVEGQVAALREAAARAAVEPLTLEPVVAHPAELNGGVREAGNKHLFEWTVVADLLRRLWEAHAEEGVLVTVDRLSGRTRYGPLLARLFPRSRVVAAPGEPAAAGSDAAADGPPDPAYEVRGPGRRLLRVRFLAGGDGKRFETALASMCSKYIRELFMEPLNAFFAARVPGLRPTAGYVEDGRRFLAEVSGAIAEMALDRSLLVRVA